MAASHGGSLSLSVVAAAGARNGFDALRARARTGHTPPPPASPARRAPAHKHAAACSSPFLTSFLRTRVQTPRLALRVGLWRQKQWGRLRRLAVCGCGLRLKAPGRDLVGEAYVVFVVQGQRELTGHSLVTAHHILRLLVSYHVTGNYPATRHLARAASDPPSKALKSDFQGSGCACH